MNIPTNIEDLTLVVISYEIYETSIEMTMSVRLCLSYDPLKMDFIAFKMGKYEIVQEILILVYTWIRTLELDQFHCHLNALVL